MIQKLFSVEFHTMAHLIIRGVFHTDKNRSMPFWRLINSIAKTMPVTIRETILFKKKKKKKEKKKKKNRISSTVNKSH